MIILDRRRTPPAPVSSVPCDHYSFYFCARRHDTPQAIKVYSRNAIQQYEALTDSAEKEVLRRIDWNFFEDGSLRGRLKGEANLSSRLITTFNAVTDGDEVMVLVQFWRNRDTIETEDTAFNSMSDPDAPGERVLPLSFLTVLKSVYHSVWDVDSSSPENGSMNTTKRLLHRPRRSSSARRYCQGLQRH